MYVPVVDGEWATTVLLRSESEGGPKETRERVQNKNRKKAIIKIKLTTIKISIISVIIIIIACNA